MIEDAELLRRYAEERDQAAFAELVQRHLAFVYGAALRQLGGASHRAEEVTQAVFVDLARKSALLARHTHLAGWLYRSTRFASAKLKRSEQRRQRREQEAHAMSEPATNPETLNWDRLRPVLDDALNELTERDRDAILLRFFEGRPFGDMGRQLGLSEDAARMRVERALGRLRTLLVRRHITSTASALAAVLAQQPAVAIPPGLAASIGSAAVLVTPAPVGLFSVILMSKITAPLISGTLAAALTLGLWTVWPGRVTARDLAALRNENASLRQATAPNAAPGLREAAARTYTDGALVLARHVEEQHGVRSSARAKAAANPAAARGPAGSGDSRPQHRDHGLATPRDASLTFAWACDTADAEALARMIWFDPEVREKALATMATLPASLVDRYPTPEQFYGFITAALSLQGPPPGADVVEQMLSQTTPKEVRPGRLAYPNRHEYQQTPEGWKWVFPEPGVTRWLHVLGDSVLTSEPGP
ncbi:MAG TPA: sigma-70 family RNA polymerase sigma factor [Opitutaceae bacterium]